MDGWMDYHKHSLQRVSIACYAKRCISHRKSVRLTD